ncbi:beta-propeller domain-containing protein [Candidatus Gracilibacteria bacterium]|nr:beta-propeller domain-containing protein [Candidatus Gracilibacteria bacterium]
MRKLILAIALVSSLIMTTHATTEDTSIIDELGKANNSELQFNLKTFNSCENYEDIMGSYIKDYWKNNKNQYLYRRGGFGFEEGGLALESLSDDAVAAPQAKSVSSDLSTGGGETDFSKTNTQVKGVDESDIVKTDGKNIYYYNSKDKYIYILNAADKKVVKKIKIPKNFYSPVMYIDNNRLTIISSGYGSGSYNGYWINRSSKTYTIVFDTTDIEKPKLLKLYVADGNLQKSRKIGDYVYIISNNYFSIPYYSFKSEADIDLEISKMLPKKLDISKTSTNSQQNLKIKGKKYPYNVKAGNVAKCREIEYILPDEDTIKKVGFNPSYNIISVVNTKDTTKEVQTKVIAGSNSEIYMSTNNLYMTSSMYTPGKYSCPINARCIMPFFQAGSSNTLVHKLNITGDTLKYQDSSMIPGSPLTQYSMDEKDNYFRILTSSNWGAEATTDLYILDKNLDLASSLNGLGKGERFQSSRFIGDKLFLVTFEQIDPLYAIDLSNQEKPEILGELKIPGFSTYLHPYDDNHLIGLGFDTAVNKWGGTARNGLKLDLYEINYDKKCGDADLSADEKAKCDSGDYKGIIVKQKFTKTFGESNSYSEATNNPRMFIWNEARKTLLLPATLYSTYPGEQYRYDDYFNGMLAVGIDKNSGIKEKYRLTHVEYGDIESQRLKECEKYSTKAEPVCRELIGGGQSCTTPNNSYVPKYCYADAKVGEYIASKSWQYRNLFIKRALWVGDKVYTLSDNKAGINDISTGTDLGEVLMGEQKVNDQGTVLY